MNRETRIAKLEKASRPADDLPAIVQIIVEPWETPRAVLLRDHPDRPDLLGEITNDEAAGAGVSRTVRARARGPIRLIVVRIVDPLLSRAAA